MPRKVEKADADGLWLELYARAVFFGREGVNQPLHVQLLNAAVAVARVRPAVWAAGPATTVKSGTSLACQSYWECSQGKPA